jgi:hypothetical protein
MSEEVRRRKVARFAAKKRQARLDGQFAALQGKPAGENPFPMNTALSQEWGRGYRNGDSG